MSNKHQPIRMCIVCKNRYYKTELNSYETYNNIIRKSSGQRRCFYICNRCLSEFDCKKLKKCLCKYVNIKNFDISTLKEILIYG